MVTDSPTGRHYNMNDMSRTQETLTQPSEIGAAYTVAREYLESAPRSVPHVRYQDEHLEIDPGRKLAFLDSQRLALTRKEYDLLTLLVENAGAVVRREVILLRVWGYGAGIRTRTLDVHVRRLRKRLGSYSQQYIETIFKIGYRFQSFHTVRRFYSEETVQG